jgi:catechol 2,3-dioxygenase-like lactoylglutathione lyase family enzyme
MQIKFASVLVDDLDKALHFYTTILGFTKMADVPMGPMRWLTVVSPDGVEGVELNFRSIGAFAPAATYQRALFDAGIPAAGFVTRDVAADFARLKEIGVRFRGEPRNLGPIMAVLFEDSCGNLINLVQPLM